MGHRLAELRCKGVSLKSFLATLERLHGRAAVERTTALLSSEPRDAFAYGKVVASGWYPIGWLKELHAAAQRATDRDEELARIIGYEGTRADFRGVYKFVASMISPETLLKQAPRVWKTYWDGGELAIDEASAGRAIARCKRCFGFDRNLWLNVIGGMQSSLELAGALDVVIEMQSGGGADDSAAELLATWR
jgi:hypothetical protein